MMDAQLLNLILSTNPEAVELELDDVKVLLDTKRIKKIRKTAKKENNPLLIQQQLVLALIHKKMKQYKGQ